MCQLKTKNKKNFLQLLNIFQNHSVFNRKFHRQIILNPNEIFYYPISFSHATADNNHCSQPRHPRQHPHPFSSAFTLTLIWWNWSSGTSLQDIFRAQQNVKFWIQLPQTDQNSMRIHPLGFPDIPKEKNLRNFLSSFYLQAFKDF